MAGLFLAAALAALVAAGTAAGGSSVLASGDPADTLFQALVAGIVTGVTLVLTMNQVVLSQELGSLADQRERLHGAVEYRQDADDFTPGGSAPAEPAAYLRTLVSAIAERGRSLGEAEGSNSSGAVAEYSRRVVDRAEAVHGRLEGRSFGDFGMLWAALHYDYSRQIQEGRSLLRDPERELSGAVREELQGVVRGLILFGSAREHFKTLYFELDLIDLSRALLAVALPALLVAVCGLLYFQPGPASGRLLKIEVPVWVLSGAVAVSLSPFALLLSFILRIATVTRRTLAAGPFVLHPDRTQGGAFDAAG